jgi:hypothetical protein
VSLDEEGFESFIANWLVGHGGYQAVKNDKDQGSPRDLDVGRGLDRSELFRFIGATQATAWAELLTRYRGDVGLAQERFLDRLAAEIDKRGTQAKTAINRQLDLLAERRQALIMAAVTGQMDVTTAKGGARDA